MISSLLIKPAGADCNMACSYCFYRPAAGLYPGTDRPRMSAEVLRELVAQYMALSWSKPMGGASCAPGPIGPAAGPGAHDAPPAALGQAAFCWQGGEPTLMGLDFYRHVVALQQQLGHPGQVVGNSLQTNGLLLSDEWARFLARYRFLVGLSLDGPPEVHDFYRLGLGGQPTQRQVVRAWRVLQQHRVEANILCMVTAHSAGRAAEVFAYLYDLGARFMQFIPCLDHHPRTGGRRPYAVTPQAYGDFLCALFEAWRPHRQEVSIRLFDDLASRLMGHEELVSCEFRPRCGDYLVVEHNGDLYACDFFVDREHFLGNLLERPLAEVAGGEGFETFAAAKGQVGEQCQACEWLSFCQGGCQRHRGLGHSCACEDTRAHATTADGRAVRDVRPHATYLCAAYRQFFAHAVPVLRDVVAEVNAEGGPGSETAAP